ncbi:hypothetical protein ACNOYE_31700 [Nannocystaceae bacterium ST9]
MSDQTASGHATIEAGLGLRARAGSRDALLRAAFDLVDTSPGLRVRRRSLVWTSNDPIHDEQVAALAVAAQFDIPGLAAAVQLLQNRLCPPALASDAVRIELLWAHDPQGTPRVVAVPPIGPDQPDRPPLPDGEIFMHPDLATRNSAAAPLVQVLENARDPATTRFVSEYLYEIPPPYVERPLPFRPAFASASQTIANARVVTLITRDRADLLAAAAECFAGAPSSAEPIGPTTLLPDPAADVTIVLALPPDCSLAERVRLWLSAVEQAMVRESLALRRATVLIDEPLAITGMLFGAGRPRAAMPALARLFDVDASIDPTTGECRAVLTLP